MNLAVADRRSKDHSKIGRRKVETQSIGSAPVHVVEHVKDFSTELNIVPLSDEVVFEDSDIDIPSTWPIDLSAFGLTQLHLHIAGGVYRKFRVLRRNAKGSPVEIRAVGSYIPRIKVNPGQDIHS